MKLLALLALAGLWHLPADSPTVPSPPPTRPVETFSPETYLADCQSLVETYTALQRLEEELGK